MEAKKSPTYYKVLEMFFAIAKKGTTKRVVFEQVIAGEHVRETIDKTAFHLQEELTIVDKHILLQISTGALKLVVQIMNELYFNNALWYFEAEHSRHYLVISELREKGILIKTEDPHIHLVNPQFVRRGSHASVLANTTYILSDVNRVSRDLIRELRSKDKITMSHFDNLLGP